MFKKIAAAGVLAAALAFSAAAPAVLSAGSIPEVAEVSARSGNWPDPASTKDSSKDRGTTPTTYSGNWPDPA